jgi:hypothetical protein
MVITYGSLIVILSRSISLYRTEPTSSSPYRQRLGSRHLHIVRNRAALRPCFSIRRIALRVLEGNPNDILQSQNDIILMLTCHIGSDALRQQCINEILIVCHVSCGAWTTVLTLNPLGIDWVVSSALGDDPWPRKGKAITSRPVLL